MLSWDKYLTTVIRTFREYYDTLSVEEKSAAQLNMTFVEPCQIEFFSFENDGQMMIVTLNSNRPDDLIVHENVKIPFSPTLKANLKRYITKERIERYEKKGVLFSGWSAIDEKSSMYFFRNFQTQYPSAEIYAKVHFKDLRRSIGRHLKSRERFSEYRAIEEDIRTIKSATKKIEDGKLRDRMLNTASKIDNSISTIKKIERYEQRLDKFEREIGGVRKMIGTTKEFQDFRIFSTDVEELKKSHVHKEVFNSKIKELSTRIDSLSEIREAYDKVLSQQNEFMKQQAKVMEQQSSVIKWIKYATILLPIAVISVPIIEIIVLLIRQSLGIL